MNMKTETQEREIALLKIFAFIGLFFGFGADIIWYIWPFNGLPAHTGGIKSATLIVQTLSALIFTIGFAWVLIRMRITGWFSMVIGAVLGSIFTAITFGLASGTYMTMAVHANVINVNPPEVSSLPFLQLFFHMFLKGARFGALVGLIPGAIAGSILSFNLLSAKDEAEA